MRDSRLWVLRRFAWVATMGAAGLIGAGAAGCGASVEDGDDAAVGGDGRDDVLDEPGEDGVDDLDDTFGDDGIDDGIDDGVAEGTDDGFGDDDLDDGIDDGSGGTDGLVDDARGDNDLGR